MEGESRKNNCPQPDNLQGGWVPTGKHVGGLFQP